MKPTAKRILVVDDEADCRQWLSEVLEGAGYEVFCASNGVEALATLHERRADLIVTDMLMPEMDGIETILALKRKLPELKIIAVSGGGYLHPAKYLRLAEAIGANETIPKPFSRDEILEAVQLLLGSSKAGDGDSSEN